MGDFEEEFEESSKGHEGASSKVKPEADSQLERDAEQLRRLGYAQQLLRDMGGLF